MRNTQDDTYDGALAALRAEAAELAANLAAWSARTEPDGGARRAASDAVNVVDAMVRDLYAIRARLISEVRRHDRAAEARAAATLGDRPG